jgi:cytochrome c oxidase subunit 2
MPTSVRKLLPSTIAASMLGLVLAGSALARAAEQSPLGPVPPASPNAHAIATIYWVVFGITVALFALVVVGLAAALVRSRRAPAGAEPAPLAGRTLALLAAVPTIAAVAVAAIVFVKLDDAKQVPAARAAGGPAAAVLPVQVEARQWNWQFTYPNGAVSLQTLRVPVGTTVRLSLTSADVTHAWWVPALGGQVRVYPGLTTHTSFRAEQTGIYHGTSTVPSGLLYALMDIDVAALPQADYDLWVADRLASQKKGSAVLGQEEFAAGCAGCHGLQNAGSRGPALGGNPALTDPKQLAVIVREGVKKMPPVGKDWSDEQIAALVAYFKEHDGS